MLGRREGRGREGHNLRHDRRREGRGGGEEESAFSLAEGATGQTGEREAATEAAKKNKEENNAPFHDTTAARMTRQTKATAKTAGTAQMASGGGKRRRGARPQSDPSLPRLPQRA